VVICFSLFEQSEAESDREAPPYSLEKVSKAEIFTAYQKLRLKYHKYRGRYGDICRLYKDLEEALTQMKQRAEKAERRKGEAEEQCDLAQKAKAHLEESLRADLEEKEHVIQTLKTKVELLKSSPVHPSSGSDVCVIADHSDGDGLEEPLRSQSGSLSEVPPSPLISAPERKISGERAKEGNGGESKDAMKEKISRLETLLERAKETIERNKELTLSLQRQVKETRAEGDRRLAEAKKEWEFQEDRVWKELEEEKERAALLLAETKRAFHQELEEKELSRGKDAAIALVRTELEDRLRKLEEELRVETAQKASAEEVQKELTRKVKGLEEELENVREAAEKERKSWLGESEKKEEEWRQQEKQWKEVEEKLTKELEDARTEGRTATEEEVGAQVEDMRPDGGRNHGLGVTKEGLPLFPPIERTPSCWRRTDSMANAVPPTDLSSRVASRVRLNQVLVTQLKAKEEELRSQIKELHKELKVKETRMAEMAKELLKAANEKSEMEARLRSELDRLEAEKRELSDRLELAESEAKEISRLNDGLKAAVEDGEKLREELQKEKLKQSEELRQVRIENETRYQSIYEEKVRLESRVVEFEQELTKYKESVEEERHSFKAM
ncbi:unnamed protein product, partial [Cyprideis torosa]